MALTAAARTTISAQPEAELAPRPGDELLHSNELRQFELFANLGRPISVERFPGSIVLRRFRKGDVICRQGDRGHSAFYIVRGEDMRKLQEFRARHHAGDTVAPVKTPDAEPAADAANRRVATAYILSGQSKATPGFLSRLFPRRSQSKAVSPQFIPNDGPADVDYATRQAPMYEGDVFGEMSCMTMAPRSASIIVDEDCYMVEFLRNIFDQMQRDAGYRQKTDELYAQRVLSAHLRRLELFQDLTDAQIEVLRQASYLEVVEPGAVICDEGDQSDSVYLIRSGVVQVVRGAHVAFRVNDVTDWPKFCRSLLDGDPATGDQQEEEAAPAGPATKPAVGSSAADILAAARQAAQPAKSETQPQGTEPQGKEPQGKEPAPKKQARPTANAADILAASRAARKPRENRSEENMPTEKPVQRTAARPAASVADILAAAKKPTASPSSPEVPSPDLPEDGGATVSTLTSAPKPAGDPKRCVWSWFTPRVQAAIRAVAEQDFATESPAADAACQLVVQAVNELIRRREFIASADLAPVRDRPRVQELIDTLPRGIAGAKKQWSELEVRIAGAYAIRELFGEGLSPIAARSGPPDILAYLSRGDCFGEMAVVLNVPRQATCIAYDHPPDDSNRRPGRVELVRIEGAAFQKLLDDSPSLRTSIDELVAKRYADLVGRDLQHPGGADMSLTHSEEFRDAGLVQGQNLLLIDLDRCTRCGDCVRACVKTHDDGYSRLFLDGPRFDRFLVPSACRQCLNPSCMIGCPVGAIKRGANGQIEITDWCIGCRTCARQCPYDSIQMHDLGIIPDQSVGWQFAPASHIGGATWQSHRYRPDGWSLGVAPFTWTIDLLEALASSSRTKSWQADVGRMPEPICFRYEFPLSREELTQGPFQLKVNSKELAVRAWINGTAITPPAPANPKQAKQDALEAQIESSQLRRGGNLLAIEVSPPAAAEAEGFVPTYNQPMLTARLDRLPQAGGLTVATAGEGVDLEVRLVEQIAVVCDLCSSLANQRPACVDQCPHEAAFRVDARFEFPAS